MTNNYQQINPHEKNDTLNPLGQEYNYYLDNQQKTSEENNVQTDENEKKINIINFSEKKETRETTDKIYQNYKTTNFEKEEIPKNLFFHCQNEEKIFSLELKIKNLNDEIILLNEKANKESSLSDVNVHLKKVADLLLKKQEFEKAKLEMEKCSQSQINEDISIVSKTCVNRPKNKSKNSPLYNKETSIKALNEKENQKTLLSKKRFEPKDNKDNNIDSKGHLYLEENNPTNLETLNSKNKRGRISNNLKEIGLIGIHTGLDIDNSINKALRNSIHNVYDSICILLENIDENLSKEFIKEIGIKNEDLKNNTNKEKFLKLSIEEIIYKYFEEDEKIKKIIEEILGKNIPGKEKQIDELKKIFKISFNKIFNAYLDNNDFINEKNNNGEENKIYLPQFKTFNDYFNEDNGYDKDKQEKLITLGKELIEGTSKKRKSRTKKNNKNNLEKEI